MSLMSPCGGRPQTVSDLAIKFDALAWLLLNDGTVVDREAERQVQGFGRPLRSLFGQASLTLKRFRLDYRTS